MSVRVTVEGGGSFELDDVSIQWLRRAREDWLMSSPVSQLAAALPPEPYQPKEGDRVNYEYPLRSGVWSNAPSDYLGKWRDFHVIGPCKPFDTMPYLLPPGTEFRRVES